MDVWNFLFIVINVSKCQKFKFSFILIIPWFKISSPEINLTKVVFPLPLSPIIAVILPFFKEKFTSFITGFLLFLNDFLRDFMVMNASKFYFLVSIQALEIVD